LKKIRNTILLFILLTILSSLNVYASNFIDTPDGSWYSNFVQYAYDKGWVQGYGNGLFGPNDTLTNSQAVTIIVRSTNLSPTENKEQWYSGFVDAAYEAGFIEGKYDWDAPISRFEMAKIIINAYDIEPTVVNERHEAHGETTISPFIDIDDPYITSLYNYGIITGVLTEDGLTFKSNKTLTRAEICTMLTRLDTHPILSEKIKNKDFSTNDYVKGYQYFIEKKASYDMNSNNSENIVNGLLYMVTNDLYEVKFNYYGEKDLIEEKANEIFDVWETLSYAYPEYFSIYFQHGIITGYEKGHYTLTFYTYPREVWNRQEALAERAILFKNAKQTVDELILSGKIKENMTETEKAYVVASWIVDNAQYDSTFESKSHYGSDFYKDGTLVCEGYTTLYNTMLKYLDINVYGVMGTSNGGNHMWSINNLDGAWKYTDTTHMDPIDLNNPTKPYFNKEYFNRTEEEMLELNPTRKTTYKYLEQIENYEIESWKI